MEIISRPQAKALGLPRYFTGKTCLNGHTTERRVSNSHCLGCDREWFVGNGKHSSKAREDYIGDWDAAHPGRKGYRMMAHYAGPAVPPWSDKEACEAFYAACPEGMQVDHIVPIRGKLVSGLHVSWNLQYLTPRDNRRKNNSFQVDP
jgi:5-methylcytosine-specific restriction endonuclease McrA